MKNKKCSVIMLPTQEMTSLFTIPNDIVSAITKRKLYNYHKPQQGNGIDEINQNLYIVNDDKIEIGDYVIKPNNTLHQMTDKDLLVYIENESNSTKKVIATTDMSLQSRCDEKCAKYECVCLLPQPSDSFIQKYIDSYNQNNVITDVLVEYNEPELSGCLNYQEGICKEPCDNAGWCPDNRNKISLKINDKFNTITIKEIKNNYNKEEVIELCKESWQVGFNVGYNEENSPSYVTANDWITKNL